MTFLANLARRGRDHPALVRPRVQGLFEPVADAPHETFVEREARSAAPPPAAPRRAAPVDASHEPFVEREPVEREPVERASVEREERSAAPPSTAPARTGRASPVVTAPPAVGRPAAEPARAGDMARPDPSARRDPASQRTATGGVVPPRPGRPQPLDRPDLAGPTTSATDGPSPRPRPPVAGRDGSPPAVPRSTTPPTSVAAPMRAPADLRVDVEGVRARTSDAARTSTPAAPTTAARTGRRAVDPTPAPGDPTSMLVVSSPAIPPRADAGPGGPAGRTAPTGQPLAVPALPASATPPRRAEVPPASPRARTHGRSQAPTHALEVDDPAGAPPAVHVTIGRIEVRATPAAPPPAPRREVPEPMSLEEHLRQRTGGRR